MKNNNANTPGKRWSRLESTAQGLTHLKELTRLLGQPQVTTSKPEYQPRCFQVWFREDGVWIHAALYRRYCRRLYWRSLDLDFRA
jgi:hypothetical protein